ncbi:MAG: helix-turn-helix transcriptional regulator [Actinomycetota bacterium]
MSDTGTESARMPNAIWEARRAAGLTEKALAERLGVSLWEVERLETGELDPSPYAEALERHTGRPRSSFRSNGASEPPQANSSAEEVARPELVSPAEHTAERLVLGSIAVLVLVRFLTEVVPVVPRAANFVDIPIVVALVVAALLRPPAQSTNDSLSRWLPALGFAFLVLSVLAAVLNPSRVDIAPALVFVYGVLSPLLVYGAVRRLWPVGRAMAASRLLVALGIVQLLVVVTIDIPRFAASSNPDAISGTFGTNAYQLVFFLLLFVTVLAGIYTHEHERRVARFAPLLITLSLVVIVLAQYRALLVTTGLCLLLSAVILGARRSRGVIVVGTALLAFMAALAFGAAKLPILKLDQTLNQDPSSLASQRLEIAGQVERLYNDEPRYIVTGTGPGTFSSRGWQTFAQSGSSSESNVAGSYALRLTGGEVYSTDVADRYVQPLLEREGEAIAGSRAVASPFSDYIAVAAEVGFLGLLILLAIYAGAFVAALRRTMVVSRRELPGPLTALLLTTTVSFFALLQMGLLENWLEVTRLTFIAWALLAISTKEFDAWAQRERA